MEDFELVGGPLDGLCGKIRPDQTQYVGHPPSSTRRALYERCAIFDMDGNQDTKSIRVKTSRGYVWFDFVEYK